MAKRKISFDIEEEQFEKIKLIVKEENIGQGEFLREIVEEAIKDYKSEDYITIYILIDNNISKFTIDKKQYRISISNPSNRMIEFVGAKKEGIIELLTGIEYDRDHLLYKTLLHCHRHNNKLSFYMK